MGIYAGVNGVVRNVPHVDVSPDGIVRHAPEGYAGINGVARKFRNVLDDIDYIKLSFEKCKTYNCNSSGTYGDVLGETYSLFRQYASLSIGSNYVSVDAYTNGKMCWVDGKMYVVFKDGHEIDIRNVVNSGLNLSISISVSYYIAANASGSGRVECLYHNLVYGQPLHDGYFEDSISGTVTITEATAKKFASQVGGGVTSGSGHSVSQQTFNSVTLGGRSFSIRAINNLT